MVGDVYQVCVSHGAGTSMIAELDTWAAARDKRNETFYGDEEIVSAWIMVVNRSLDLVPRKYGATMRRHRREGKRKTA